MSPPPTEAGRRQIKPAPRIKAAKGRRRPAIGGAEAQSLPLGEYAYVSLRGAILTDLDLPPSPRDPSFRPCAACGRPCVAACPIDTFAGGHWDFVGCVRYRLFEDGCPDGCLSRRACVVGHDQQYSHEEYSYRHFFTEATRVALTKRYDDPRPR